MKRLLTLGLLFLLVTVPALAQLKPITQPLHTAETGDENGNEITVDGYSSISLQVTNTGTGTIAFQGTQNQSTWSAVVCVQVGDTAFTPITETTTTMTVRCNVAGLVKFRAPITSNDGAVTVTATSSPAVMGSGGGGGSGSGSGITAGTSFPGSPSTNQLFLITDDSAAGECDSSAGSAVTLCRWDGANWASVNIIAEADTLDTVFDRGKTIDAANSFANAFKVLDANGDGFAIYTDATDGPIFVCVDNSVENACTSYTRELASGQTLVYKNSGGTAIFTLTESTGALTNVTLNGESTGNTITLTEEKHWRVASCQNTTAQAVFDLATANTPAPTCDTGTNTQKAYLAFDATTDESFEDSWILPTGFTGAIDIHFRWKAAATSGAVGWCAQLVRVPDAATSDPAYPAQAAGNCVSDTAKGTTLQENTATISGVTCTSCVAGDHVYVRISRDANGGAVTDDMTGDAFLLTYGRTWRVAH